MALPTTPRKSPLQALANRNRSSLPAEIPTRPVSPVASTPAVHSPSPLASTTIETVASDVNSPLAAPVHTAPKAKAAVNKKPATPAEPKAEVKKPLTRNRKSPLTDRDLAIIKFIGRARLCKVEHVVMAMRGYQFANPETGEVSAAGAVRMNTLLKKLAGPEHGYLKCYTLRADGETIRLWYLTSKGERIAGTGMPSVLTSMNKWKHTLAMASLLAKTIGAGGIIITDNEILSATERLFASDKTRIVKHSVFKDDDTYGLYDQELAYQWAAAWNIPLEQRSPEGHPIEKGHRPDMVLLSEDKLPEAAEVELSYKTIAVLTQILDGYLMAFSEGRLSGVRYVCPPKIEAYIRKRLTTMGVVEGHKHYEKFVFINKTLEELHANVPIGIG